VFKTRALKKILLFCFNVFLIMISCFSCLNPKKDSQHLTLKGSLAELNETVVLDPAFLARQQQAEKNFFGFSQNNEEIFDHSKLVTEENHLIPEDPTLLVSFRKQKKKFKQLHMVWPTAGRLTSLFGMRRLKNKTRMHYGIDIGAKVGTPIHSCANGQILFSGVKRGYGLSVIIAHDRKHETLYAHMSRTVVRNGQFVKRNQIIGYVGTTGQVTGANLHFEIRIAGVAYNPLQYLPPNRFRKMKIGMKTPSTDQSLVYSSPPTKYAYHFQEKKP
jgi:murein DD-endopeptidase MepM/ murein hydrolase activator NlpD